MPELQTYSYHDGEAILEQKGVLDEIHQMPAIWSKYPRQGDYSNRFDALTALSAWETEVQIDLGPEDRAHYERLTPFLDAYHPVHHVAIEHETKEQMRARWHLMKIQAAHEREETLPIDVAVLLFPTERDPSLRRTRRELEGPFFSEHFPITIPVYVVEYTPVESA